MNRTTSSERKLAIFLIKELEKRYESVIFVPEDNPLLIVIRKLYHADESSFKDNKSAGNTKGLSIDVYKEDEYLGNFPSATTAAKEFGFSPKYIQNFIRENRKKTRNGYIFKKAEV